MISEIGLAENNCEHELAAVRTQLVEAQAHIGALDREADELNHRIANSLQLVASFIVLQQRGLTDESAKEALTMASARVASIAALHRHVAGQGAKPSVDFARFLHELGQEIASSLGLECEVEADSVAVSGETARQLAIVVNELAINSGKHAYATEGGKGTIHIRCHREPDDGIRLIVADGGCGLPDGFDVNAGHGLGMSIVSGIARQLGGALEAVSANGACFTVHVPGRGDHSNSRAY